MAKEEIAIVDDKDNVIGHRSREVVDTENLRYRVSALWIRNREGKILLARRAYTKTHDPGKWGPAAAGTVAKGESYLETIVREAKEELGLEGVKFKQGPKVRNDGEHRYFGQWFVSTVDRPSESFKLQSSEVAEIKWFSKEELRRQLDKHPEEFLKNISKELDLMER